MFPFPLDLALQLWIGLFFSACARRQIGEGLPPWGRELGAVTSFAVFGSWPLALYFHFVHGGWAWLYLIDPGALPASALGALAAGQLALLLVGFGVGWGAARRGERRTVDLALLALALLFALALLSLHHRLLVVGSFATFHSALPLPHVLETKLAWVWPVSLAGRALVLGAIAWALRSWGVAAIHFRPMEKALTAAQAARPAANQPPLS